MQSTAVGRAEHAIARSFGRIERHLFGMPFDADRARGSADELFFFLFYLERSIAGPSDAKRATRGSIGLPSSYSVNDGGGVEGWMKVQGGGMGWCLVGG